MVTAHSVQAITETGGVSGTKNPFPLNHTLFTPSTYPVGHGFTFPPAPVFNNPPNFQNPIYHSSPPLLPTPVNPAEPKVNQKTLKPKLNFLNFDGTNPRGWL